MPDAHSFLLWVTKTTMTIYSKHLIEHIFGYWHYHASQTAHRSSLPIPLSIKWKYHSEIDRFNDCEHNYFVAQIDRGVKIRSSFSFCFKLHPFLSLSLFICCRHRRCFPFTSVALSFGQNDWEPTADLSTFKCVKRSRNRFSRLHCWTSFVSRGEAVEKSHTQQIRFVISFGNSSPSRVSQPPLNSCTHNCVSSSKEEMATSIRNLYDIMLSTKRCERRRWRRSLFGQKSVTQDTNYDFWISRMKNRKQFMHTKTHTHTLAHNFVCRYRSFVSFVCHSWRAGLLPLIYCSNSLRTWKYKTKTFVFSHTHSHSRTKMNENVKFFAIILGRINNVMGTQHSRPWTDCNERQFHTHHIHITLGINALDIYAFIQWWSFYLTIQFLLLLFFILSTTQRHLRTDSFFFLFK